ncbi:MAG TPA: hypothetical protein VGZ22_24365 [Isosphaeraceae bacterium]|jgi:hypothetical protein|nr:hypothetical protein [Isosphaeraceae bacterium]
MDGVIIPGKRVEWKDEVARDPEAYVRGLKELGVSPEVIHEELVHYHTLTRPILTRLPVPLPELLGVGQSVRDLINGGVQFMDGLWRAVQRLFDHHSETTLETDTVPAIIPLFRLDCPPVAGSKVTYKETHTSAGEASWTIKVPGVGMGATQDFKVQYSSSFDADAGQCKLVFVPVRLVVSRVEYFRRGKRIGEGMRIEMEEPSAASMSIQKGVMRLLPPDDAQPRPSNAIQGCKFPLALDKPGAISTHTQAWTETREFDLEVGFKVFHTDNTCKANLSQERELELTFELPGGHDYLLRHVNDLPGVWWQVDPPP